MSKRHSAFTLIELLVVIAIIALLLSIIMPSLDMAKRKAAGVVCMSNEKQLSLAWTLFAADNDDTIVDGEPDSKAPYDGFTTYSGFGKVANFITVPVNETYTAADYTLEGRIRGLERGGLWMYLENYKIYHCPADKRTIKDELRYGYRTYSIGKVYSRSPPGQWGDTGEKDVSVNKMNQIKNPGSKFVWVEEMDVQEKYNNYTWNHFLNEQRWGDPLAVWHGDSSTFGFADGHAERYKWSGQEVLQRGDFGSAVAAVETGTGQKVSPVLTDPKDIEDWRWVTGHYVPVPGKLNR
jgi:prepilin-type N-terminal cleavage/methylation domain-containing protein/prepilin-type processing-associated H-X9-DG protein